MSRSLLFRHDHTWIWGQNNSYSWENHEKLTLDTDDFGQNCFSRAFKIALRGQNVYENGPNSTENHFKMTKIDTTLESKCQKSDVKGSNQSRIDWKRALKWSKNCF